MIQKILDFIYYIFLGPEVKESSTDDSKKRHAKSQKQYVRKSFMTNYEYGFYKKMLPLEESLNIKIIPQLNLATIIKKISNDKYQSELYRNIDFAVFNKELTEVLLLIEINDKTHDDKKRQYRDARVRTLARDIGVELMTFYTNYENKIYYVQNRITNSLTKSLGEKVEETVNEVANQEIIDVPNELVESNDVEVAASSAKHDVTATPSQDIIDQDEKNNK